MNKEVPTCWTPSSHYRIGDQIKMKIKTPRTKLQRMYDWLFGIKRRKTFKVFKRKL